MFARMKLKEFELDFPYKKNDKFIKNQLEKGMTITEAEGKDYQINWKWERRKFQLATRCMTSLIERLMEPTITEECWKIMIECTEDEIKEPVLAEVIFIQHNINFNDFFSLNDVEKKKKTIDIVWDCLHLWEDKIPFDMKNIYRACQKVRELEYVNKRKWKRPIKSSQYIAQFEIEHDVKSADIYVSVYDHKRNFVKRKLMVRTQPHEWSICDYLGKIEWIAKDEIALHSQEGQVFTCKV